MWPRLINVVLGLWLMAAPAVLGYAAPASTNDRIVGPLVAAFATIAIWETTRWLRWLNAALAVWLLLAPWLLGYETTIAGAGLRRSIVNSSLTALVIFATTLVRGPMKERFGGGWSSLWAAPSEQ